MKVIIEIPDGWLDENVLDNLAFITRTCREEIQHKLMTSATEKALKSMKIPKITISKSELKKAILNRMVDERMKDNG